jgi:hypothetical protein
LIVIDDRTCNLNYLAACFHKCLIVAKTGYNSIEYCRGSYLLYCLVNYIAISSGSS